MKKCINDLDIKQTRSKKWNKFNQCALDNINVFFAHFEYMKICNEMSN